MPQRKGRTMKDRITDAIRMIDDVISFDENGEPYIWLGHEAEAAKALATAYVLLQDVAEA